MSKPPLGLSTNSITNKFLVMTYESMLEAISIEISANLPNHNTDYWGIVPKKIRYCQELLKAKRALANAKSIRDEV
jgi:hypothetical protein